ncbi:prolyl oligopeptidase [Sphingopyxis panaciterrae]|uniref:prolyl oligopeptidase family serine peptidase n=1 Tax=Sphingopyxis panaciterrae TaxID=363841 RepID=UPI001421E1CF|nr:prolyl oligopeptidase family serine peptidase [Sphingopyxis panaciterrae]NIJ35982.1 prolyl oligopeptidase [Sphingopyxis panaciterrae]
MTETLPAAQGARPKYPQVEPRPETVEFGGISYQDPFRWLEEDADPAVTAWQAAQDALTQAHLVGLPGFGAFSDRLAVIGAKEDPTVPIFAGGRWFRKYVPEGQNLAVVELSESPTGAGRRVVDLNAMQTGEPLQLSTFIPSPDGRKAIFGWAAGGREEPHCQIIDVDTGAVLVDGLPQKQPLFFAWLPGSSAIVYSVLDPASAVAKLFRFVLDAPEQPTVEPVEFNHPVVRPVVSADGRYLLAFVDHLAPRPDYILDLQGDGVWQPFLKDVPGIFRGDVLESNFIAVIDDGASRGRVVSIPLATPDRRETWKEIVPASDNVPGVVLITGGRALVLDLVQNYARLRVFGKDGDFEGEIELPGRGVVNSFSNLAVLFNMIDPVLRAEDGRVIFAFSTFATAPVLCIADVATRKLTALGEPSWQLDVQVVDRVGKSADGASISYQVVARSDLDLSTRPPTVIHGYGGFNVAMLPGWLGAQWAAWIEAGGVLALAQLRGGGEYGATWWEQGRLKNKQNSFNDVFAVAEDLIAHGIATPGRLGVIGGSNGGVMAAVVAVQRPDLFRASVPQVPISDLLARVRDPVTMVSTLDYGDPADPETAASLYAWSPYQNVRDGVAYPAMLIDCGGNDPRCPAWHGRKLAARLQQASGSDLPTLLRVRAEAGHGAVGKDQRRHQSAEVLAFLAGELGLAV